MPSQERVDLSSQPGHRATWRNWQTVLLLLGSVVVLLLALRVRLPNLGGRSLLLDECFHNESVLDSPDLASLRRSVSPQYQPLLDYFLRRFIWAPLFGTSELGLRLPSLIASLLAVLATIATVAWGFVKNGRAWTEAVVAALALGV
jgi:predicted membrane-bound mannosyltransferase